MLHSKVHAVTDRRKDGRRLRNRVKVSFLVENDVKGIPKDILPLKGIEVEVL